MNIGDMVVIKSLKTDREFATYVDELYDNAIRIVWKNRSAVVDNLLIHIPDGRFVVYNTDIYITEDYMEDIYEQI